MSVTREIEILLIEDDLDYADHIRSLLDSQPSYRFRYERVSLISEALKLLRDRNFDTILIDFSLKELNSLDRILEISNATSDTPIVGLINASDEDRANEAIEYGLQDRIIKNEYDEFVIVSKILFTIKRHEAEKNTLARQKVFPDELLYDKRTGLPNQVLFKDRLEQALLRADRDQTSLGLVAVHLKQFSLINEKHGYRVAESALQRAAKLLGQSVRKCDTVAHVEDDKFMVVLEGLEKTSGAITLSERIIRAFSRTMRIGNHNLKMTASAGIAMYPDCKGFHELIQSAEWAMKRAGDAGGNRYKLYTDNLSEEAIWKYSLENDLEKALEEQQFELHYQPLFDLRKRKVIGLEALLRWNHPEEGPMMPGAFIDQLEASDMILEVGEWVLDEACRKLKVWQSKYPSFMMGINLSARQLQDPYLLERISSILQKHNINPASLELEITERQLVDKNDAVSQYNIQALVDHGLNLALDDFGTGYSTESYFQHFPDNTIHTLKIDRKDIQGMLENDAIAERVEKYIEFSHKNNMRVIAEGIEHLDQLERVQMLGVDVIQGFLLSKAVSSSEIEDGLRRNQFSLQDLRSKEVLKLYEL